ncbi:MAG: hypothetical protein ACRD0L_12295 [Acidimicrobiales bacterium]
MAGRSDPVMAGDEVRRFIRAIRADDDLRSEVERAILSRRLLDVPDQLASLVEVVRALTDQMNQRFDQVDRRFEQVDQRFEQVDQRFDQVDQRFDQVDRRLDQVDRRLDQDDRRLDQVENQLKEGRRQLGQLGSTIGVFTEEEAGDVLRGVAEDRGWALLDEPRRLDFGRGEVDVVVRLRTGSGEVTALVESKLRLKEPDVAAFARLLADPAWLARLEEMGLRGPWLPFVYGMGVYDRVTRFSSASGIGVLSPKGLLAEATARP